MRDFHGLLERPGTSLTRAGSLARRIFLKLPTSCLLFAVFHPPGRQISLGRAPSHSLR